MTATTPRIPTYPAVQHHNIPSILTDRDQWVAWRWEFREGKFTKVPINPRSGKRAKANDPSTWATFAEACQCAARLNIGIGYVFHQSDPVAGIDFDDCLDPETGELDPIALDRIRSLDSYAEISPSGTGVKVIVVGKLPPEHRRNDAQRVEMYDDRRLFTLTGNLLPGAPATIEQRQYELDQLHSDVFAHKLQQPKPTFIADPGGSLFTDDEVIERALASKSGTKFAQLFFQGDTSGNNGNDSGADMALCNLLRFFTRGDTSQMDRLFRRSALMRDKWDKPARSGETYGEGTIKRALPGDVYTPPPPAPQIVFDAPQPVMDAITAQEGTGKCSEALGRIRELELHLAGMQARVDQLEADNQRLREERTWMMQVLRNPNLKGEKITALALMFETDSKVSREQDRDGWVHIPRARIAEAAGCSESTVSTHIARLEHDGILQKRVTRGVTLQGEPISEMHVKISETTAETMKKLADLNPDRPKHGGRRVYCPDHPEADVIVRRTVMCADCGQIIEETEQRITAVEADETLKSQDATSEIPQRPNVDVVPRGSIMRHHRQHAENRVRRRPTPNPSVVSPAWIEGEL